MTHIDNANRDPEHVRKLLASLKAQAQERFDRTAREVEHDRRVAARAGRTPSEIASAEFSELRFFEDLDSDNEATSSAALAGTPSAVTMALAERDRYCLECFRHWYGVWAKAYREEATN